MTRPDDPFGVAPLSHPTSAAILTAHVGVDVASRYPDPALVARVRACLERLVLHCTEPLR